MKISEEETNRRLKEAGLKVTPQRHAILEAVLALGNHPTAESVAEYVRNTHPGIAVGTIYKVLDALVNKGLIIRVKTDKDAMRYDGILTSHHHVYCSETEKIEDYIDEDLDKLLEDYFRKKSIRNFEIENITLQIKGNFKQK